MHGEVGLNTFHDMLVTIHARNGSYRVGAAWYLRLLDVTCTLGLFSPKLLAYCVMKMFVA